MLSLMPPRPSLLALAAVATVGMWIFSCSKDKDSKNSDPLPLRDPTSISPNFVNTAKTRQEASSQILKTSTFSSKAAEATLSLAAVPDVQLPRIFSGSLNTPSIKITSPSAAMRITTDDDSDSSSTTLMSDFLSLSEGDDCEKIATKFDESYDWESKIVTSAIGLFSVDESHDSKFGAGNLYFASTFETDDHIKMGVGANKDLGQSIISLISTKNKLTVQQVTLLDEKAKTLTTKFFASGVTDKSVDIKNFDLTMQSIASAKPKLMLQQKAEVVADGVNYKVDGDLTIEKAGERQFDVKAIQNSVSENSKRESENLSARITWGADGKCKIEKI